MFLFHTRLWPALTFFALLLGILACSPSLAHAARRIYLAGYMGLNIFPTQEFTESTSGVEGEIEISEGHNFAGAIGFKLTPQLRIEGELSYTSADLSGIDIYNLGSFDVGGSVDSTIAMLNIYYDFDFDWKKLRPFVGAGFGYGWHDGSIDDVSGFAVDASSDTSGYVWQVGGGVRYPLGETVSLIGAYKYMDGADLEFDNYKIDYGTHEFRLGLSWDLPFE